MFNRYIDILHLFFTPYMDVVPDKIKESFAPASKTTRNYRILRNFARLITKLPVELFYYTKEKPDKNKVWVYLETKNNYDAIAPVLKSNELQLDISLVALGKKLSIEEAGPIRMMPMYFKGLFSYKYFSVLRKLKLKYGKLASRNSYLIFLATGAYESCHILLKKKKPRAIIFINDININSRALLWAAKDLNIPTVYIQHASVSRYFPSLRFDLSLLEGRDAWEKYKQIGNIEGEIKLIGCPKFDPAISRQNNSDRILNIGVCSNLLDDTEVVMEVISMLDMAFKVHNMKISYRPHPRQKNELILPESVHLSESSTENALEFLAKQDLIIASNSNILLEAVMLNVSAIKYNLSLKPSDDYYGFVENGLVDELSDINQLEHYVYATMNKRIKNKPKAKWYNDTIGTKYEGGSADLAAEEIRKFLSRRQLQ